MIEHRILTMRSIWWRKSWEVATWKAGPGMVEWYIKVPEGSKKVVARWV